jgi:hypothetical protein
MRSAYTPPSIRLGAVCGCTVIGLMRIGRLGDELTSPILHARPIPLTGL